MPPLFLLAPSSAPLGTVAMTLHLLPALLISFLMMSVLSWKSSFKRKQDEGDQPVTCFEASWGQPRLGGEGMLSASRQLLCSPGFTFRYSSFSNHSKKISVLSEGKVSDSSEQDLCLLYRPSPGKAQPYYCNTNGVKILPCNPGGFKGEQIGCSAC